MSGAPVMPPAGPFRRSLAFRLARAAAAFALLALAAAGGALFYASTPHFKRIVRQRVVAELSRMTGGRVEIGGFHWSLLRLSVELDNLTIHGLEGPGELPYAHVDRLYLRAKILSRAESWAESWAGSQTGPRIGLRALELDRPVFHLIVYADGRTNQPHPPAGPPGKRSLTDTIFDLQANRVAVYRGVVVLNRRAMPFSLEARDFGALVRYAPASGRYLGEMQAGDILIERGAAPPWRSSLAVSFALARNLLRLRSFRLAAGTSALEGSGSIENFSHPRWSGAVNGEVDLGECAAFTGLGAGSEGRARIGLEGRGQGADFVFDGSVRLEDAGYRTRRLSLSGVDGSAHLRLTEDEISLTAVSVALRRGGAVEGSVQYRNWRAVPALPAGAGRAPTPLPVGQIRAQVRGLSLLTALGAFAPPRFQSLGFETLAEGPVSADWSGDASDLTVSAALALRSQLRSAPGEAPLDGRLEAKYLRRVGRVILTQLQIHTPAASAQASGLLGVYPMTQPSNLQVHVRTRGLGEFDRLLALLHPPAGKRKGAAALPLQLHGEATFDGRVSGPLVDPEAQGRVTAADFSIASEPLAALRWDRLEATGDYSSRRISIQTARIVRGPAEIRMNGEIRADPGRGGRPRFDRLSSFTASASLRNAPLAALLQAAGRTLPATGTVNVALHAAGSIADIQGGGQLSLRRGEVVGQPYRSLRATLAFTGRRIELSALSMQFNHGTIAANGLYRLDSRDFLVNLDGRGFQLAGIPQLQNPRVAFAGDLKFDAHASGPLDAPSVLAGLHVDRLVVGGKPADGLDAVVHTRGDEAYFTLRSRLASPLLRADGETRLRGDLPTQAQLSFSGLDMVPLFEVLRMQDVPGISGVSGAVHLSGPLGRPREFSGEARIDTCDIALQGLHLENRGPLVGSIHQGAITLTAAHIVGPDTDLQATGRVDLLGDRLLRVRAQGAVNMQLMQSFDPDIAASGQMTFHFDVSGDLSHPSFTGQARLSSVSLALHDVPNGIRQLNGELVFNQNRLELRNLSGRTGGGQLNFGGFLTYQNGVYGDLTASGKAIRVRYAGISATADTSLHLQGAAGNMLLSGNVLLSRFMIGANLDVASLAGGQGATTLPDPSAPSSHIHLDIHLTSSPQLDFENSYAQLAGGVDLRIRGTIAQPSLLGRINITDGTATLAGTTYELQRGQIYFTNPAEIEPIVDLDATTRIDEYDISVGLHGSASHLTPMFRSDPPLPQAEVISLLALGRTQEGEQYYSQQEQQMATSTTSNALLNGALNAAEGSRMQRLFGGANVRIDPSYVGTLGGPSARITVQQNLSRNIQITYATNVNASSQQFIQGQVNLTDNIAIVAQQDEAGVISLVLRVHRRIR